MMRKGGGKVIRKFGKKKMKRGAEKTSKNTKSATRIVARKIIINCRAEIAIKSAAKR